MKKAQLLQLLHEGHFYNPYDSNKTTEQHIQEMDSEEIKAAVIEYIYTRNIKVVGAERTK